MWTQSFQVGSKSYIYRNQTLQTCTNTDRRTNSYIDISYRLSDRQRQTDRRISKHIDQEIWTINFQKALRQLSSLLRHADTLFHQLETDCGAITERTVKLKTRVSTLDEKCGTLNARKVKIRKFFCISIARRLFQVFKVLIKKIIVIICICAKAFQIFDKAALLTTYMIQKWIKNTQ